MEKLYTLNEARKLLAVSISKLRIMIKNGEIETIVISENKYRKTIRISEASLRKFVEEHKLSVKNDENAENFERPVQ